MPYAPLNTPEFSRLKSKFGAPAEDLMRVWGNQRLIGLGPVEVYVNHWQLGPISIAIQGAPVGQVKTKEPKSALNKQN